MFFSFSCIVYFPARELIKKKKKEHDRITPKRKHKAYALACLFFILFPFRYSISLPKMKTKNAMIPENINPLTNEKFLAVSEITLCMASSCSGAISSLLKNPFPFKSYFCRSNFNEISTKVDPPTIRR